MAGARAAAAFDRTDAGQYGSQRASQPADGKRHFRLGGAGIGSLLAGDLSMRGPAQRLGADFCLLLLRARPPGESLATLDDDVLLEPVSRQSVVLSARLRCDHR